MWVYQNDRGGHLLEDPPVGFCLGLGIVFML